MSWDFIGDFMDIHDWEKWWWFFGFHRNGDSLMEVACGKRTVCYWRWPIYSWFTHQTWSFSMAILVYRVSLESCQGEVEKAEMEVSMAMGIPNSWMYWKVPSKWMSGGTSILGNLQIVLDKTYGYARNIKKQYISMDWFEGKKHDRKPLHLLGKLGKPWFPDSIFPPSDAVKLWLENLKEFWIYGYARYKRSNLFLNQVVVEPVVPNNDYT